MTRAERFQRTLHALALMFILGVLIFGALFGGHS